MATFYFDPLFEKAQPRGKQEIHMVGVFILPTAK
jgi:hypothetical protein